MAIFVGLLVLTILHLSVAAPVTDGTELIFAFMVHRHGDRTPISSSLSMITNTIDLDAAEALIDPWGYGQLTDLGKQRAYRTGQFIRRRYDELLAEKFNRSEIYIRSTDSTRTKMTVLTALAAVYPAIGDTWSEEINWVPIPYTTVPAKYDFNQYSLNCPNFNLMTAMYSSSSEFDQYSELLVDVSNLIGIDITSVPVLTYSIYDVYVAMRNLGYDLGADVEALLPQLKAAAAVAVGVLLDSKDNLPYIAGPFLNEFFEYAASIIDGEDTPRVRVYSAHDLNVYALEAITQVANKQGVPQYASLYSLELRKVTATGKYAVLPVYLTTPEEPEMYLQIEGCDSVLCDYDQFYEITSPFIRTESVWRTECGFDPDMVIDTSGVD